MRLGIASPLSTYFSRNQEPHLVHVQFFILPFRRPNKTQTAPRAMTLKDKGFASPGKDKHEAQNLFLPKYNIQESWWLLRTKDLRAQERISHEAKNLFLPKSLSKRKMGKFVKSSQSRIYSDFPDHGRVLILVGVVVLYSFSSLCVFVVPFALANVARIRKHARQWRSHISEILHKKFVRLFRFKVR